MNYLVPELLLQDRRARRALLGAQLRRRGGPPMIELLGVEPAAAERLLNRIHLRYDRTVPVNHPRLPLGSATEREKERLRASVVDCLWYLSTRSRGLGGYLGNRPRIRFPRFTLGILVYQWAQRENVKELATIARGLRTVRQVQESRTEVPGNILDPLANLGVPGGIAALGLALGYHVLPGNRHRAAIRWWGRVVDSPPRWLHRPRGAVLDDMFNLVTAGRDHRDRSVESLLAAALLADLDAYYNTFRRLNRDLLPLVLLPGADTPSGRALLRAFRGAYQRVFDPLDGRRYKTMTRPVVIAVGSRAAPEGAGGTPGRLDTLEQRLREWRPTRGQGSQDRWMLRVAVARAGESREGEQ
ncbi:hypothetical protein [Streptomyces sp. NPDC002851]